MQSFAAWLSPTRDFQNSNGSDDRSSCRCRCAAVLRQGRTVEVHPGFPRSIRQHCYRDHHRRGLQMLWKRFYSALSTSSAVHSFLLRWSPRVLLFLVLWNVYEKHSMWLCDQRQRIQLPDVTIGADVYIGRLIMDFKVLVCAGIFCLIKIKYRSTGKSLYSPK